MFHYEINPTFNEFKDDLLNIRDHFDNSSNSIHKARNELKILQLHNRSVVVKSFKVLNIIRKIYYKYFRDTKAKKSYIYALKIGSFTPEPIGYIEFYKDNLLQDSYFLAQNFQYDFTIREPLLDKKFPKRDDIFKAFTSFTYKLHQNNILHKDYSPGNILVKKENDNYIFKIVDINRMEFKKLSLKQRLQNFDKLWADDEDLIIIATQYASLINLDKKTLIKDTLSYSNQLKKRKNIKKTIKRILQ